jgi:hypothetical protein
MADAWEVQWMDGNIFHGDSASAVLAQVAAMMWDAKDRDNPKKAVAQRLWSLTHEFLDEEISDPEFVYALEKLGYVKVLNPH